MIKIKFKKCCDACGCVDVYVDAGTVYSGATNMLGATIIGCKHEKVCGEYLLEADKKSYSDSVNDLAIGDVYDIVHPDYLFVDSYGTSTGQYVQGVLTDFSLDLKIAELKSQLNDDTIFVDIYSLRRVNK